MNWIDNMVVISPDDGHASRVTALVGRSPRDRRQPKQCRKNGMQFEE